MNKELTKLQAGLRSGIRSLQPIGLSLFAMLGTGQITTKQLFSTETLISVLGAAFLKGGWSGATAKSVEIKPTLGVKF